jgi:hypothetical protein
MDIDLSGELMHNNRQAVARQPMLLAEKVSGPAGLPAGLILLASGYPSMR